jgi:hypothetical protein
VAIVVSPFVGVELTLFHDSILWSLAAELIYYTLYPAFLAMHRSGVSWLRMFAGSFLLALALATTDPSAKSYPSWGEGLNWVLGLPCWLAGCVLAQRVADGRWAAPAGIWRWRFAVWAASVLLSALRFHSPLGYPWTLNLFAILVAF